MKKTVAAALIGLLALGVFFLAILFVRSFSHNQNKAANTGAPAIAEDTYPPSLSGNGFLPTTDNPSLSGPSQANNTNTAAPTPVKENPSPVVPTATPSSPTVPTGNGASQLSALPWPTVSDQEITIASSGVSSTLGFLAYFSENIIHLPIDKSVFTVAEKDASGTPLFTSDLVLKVVDGATTSSTYPSLVTQQKITQAELAFLKTIPVTPSVAPLDKELVGSEKLTLALIEKALDVQSGKTTLSDLSQYYAQYSITIVTAHNQLAKDMKTLSMQPRGGTSWFDNTLSYLGLHTPAQAQSTLLGYLPFGGELLFQIPCLCSVGEWITIGTPVPAEIFASYFWMATPLFYPYKSLRPGAWWLGLYDPEVIIPCLSVFFCSPVGAGGLVIIAGTSI